MAVRALVFATSLWLLADQDFSPFQLVAFIVIGAVLYFTPVFHTLLIFPSFLTLMIISPVAMSVFGPQIHYPSLLAGFFGVLFFIILGIKQVVFVSRIKLYHTLHLGLFYFLSILFFAAPTENWFISRCFAFGLLAYMLIRELFIIRGVARGPHLKLTSALFSFLTIEAVWAISLLPIGFINAAGILLVFLFALEELALLGFQKTLNKRALVSELVTFGVLLAMILVCSTWSLP